MFAPFSTIGTEKWKINPRKASPFRFEARMMFNEKRFFGVAKHLRGRIIQIRL
ncbi:hypothetical protein HMPREF1981_02739 [Bacteroides pyogenes F0041]|uniref:Uncharacterized protein n=1 Tax=Bacteroides pyogenes F0041 TaxID=1321819 RepID=U2BV30_9BACE|nr:hypothetical protein HMPREF1981_02739 [Bacteroides pyogenes F0041]MBB3894510.1 hypothetical protein [Bacteroides pyogenes]GAE21637.1 hypothetical protein JCM10003_1114 [Bacteroides pyogenes JCM 10003]SUV32414.1 Uncharacterised protein [Bacteroides pyogenes]